MDSGRNPNHVSITGWEEGTFYEKKKGMIIWIEERNSYWCEQAELLFICMWLVTDSLFTWRAHNHRSLRSGCLVFCWLYKQLFGRRQPLVWPSPNVWPSSNSLKVQGARNVRQFLWNSCSGSIFKRTPIISTQGSVEQICF